MLKTWLLIVLLALPLGPATAHNKSLSFSSWLWGGQYLDVSFTTPSRDVTLLPEYRETGNLGLALAAHVTKHVRLTQINTPCRLEEAFSRAGARDGYIRVSGRFICFDDNTAVRIDNNAFFNLAASHVHFARLALAGQDRAHAAELLFTATQRQHFIRPDNDGRLSSHQAMGESFTSYFMLGVEHILSGWDHLAFVLCLVLVSTSRRHTIWLVTGFTLGHSVTLALAALGWVVPNSAAVEALIGLSIAIVAVESVFSHRRQMPGFGYLLTGLLFAGAGLAIFVGSQLPLGAWAGLMLFCLAYCQLHDTPQTAQRFAPVLTAAFGLVHGFGFGGLLIDIGLPQDNLLLGLLGFNLGVEAGQLLVLLPVLVFGPILMEEVSGWRLRWHELGASALTGYGTFLFVTRAFL